jgi:ribonuclease D
MTEEVDSPEPISELLDKPRLATQLVDTDKELKAFLTELGATTEPIALDAERASGFRYGQRAYLLQVAIKGSKIFLIDPVAPFTASFWDEFIDAIGSHPWIIHAASQDLPCLSELNIKPTKILDTELAARLLGLPRVALGTLTEHYLQLRLAKEHSAVDWSERPLPANWLNYAALDVDVLFDLWDRVEFDLVAQNKTTIAEAEFEYLLHPAPKAAKVDRWRSMTGLHEVKDQRDLTIAKHLWTAREELAIEKDVAPGRLIPDVSIVAAVKAHPLSRSELASLKSFAGRASRTFIDTWWKAIEEGASTRTLVELRPKSTGIPNHRNWPQKFPKAHARLLASKELIAQISVEQEMPQENILNPEALRGICFEPPEQLTSETISQSLRDKYARQWQIDLVVEGFVATLATEEAPAKEVELDTSV